MLKSQADKEKISKLIAKYGGSVPRYTSYPTAPEWKDEYSQNRFEDAIRDSNLMNDDYSLYLHLPFCESQCYYCGCNVVISKEHGIEKKYIEQVKEELHYYGDLIKKNRKVIQMAWGGGTPTYLSPEQIVDLSEHIVKHFSLYKKDAGSLKEMAEKAKELSIDCYEHEYACEIDPRVTSREHLEALWQAGFNRLSMGIQDFNPETQETINRIQPAAMVEKIVSQARDIGFKSINFDLIYGLPHQNLETFTETIEIVKGLDPERIALFNYAHIPSIFPFQKKYIADETLPDKDTKTQIFDKAVEEFVDFGYEFIGLDHFAKPDDGLAVAQKNRTLYRNFQGYTTHSGADLYGFGITAISDVQGVYKQNYKKLNDYYETIFGGDKFKICSRDDRERREIIKQIMCNGFATVPVERFSAELKALQEMISEGLVEWGRIADLESSEQESWVQDRIRKAKQLIDPNQVYIRVTDLGRLFVRNIASIFDSYIRKEDSHKIFSTSL